MRSTPLALSNTVSQIDVVEREAVDDESEWEDVVEEEEQGEDDYVLTDDDDQLSDANRSYEQLPQGEMADVVKEEIADNMMEEVDKDGNITVKKNPEYAFTGTKKEKKTKAQRTHEQYLQKLQNAREWAQSANDAKEAWNNVMYRAVSQRTAPSFSTPD